MCCFLFAKSCLTLCNPRNISTAGFPCPHYLLYLIMLSNHLILCCPLLLLPSTFPNIRVFSSESALHIRWPKYWRFGFSTSPSSKSSGLISFRMIPCNERLNNNIPQRCLHVHGKQWLILTPSRTKEGMLSSEEPHGWLQKEEG